ncbi:CBS domain-containing protein [Salinisphaera hydrothermalis]|uniref:CBS domain-containing membrane protein n=1 Tax=Salinisphaera hydrothermalis (strain C41B8) TaxID=1304275 RepID=A0A084IKQ4_SALHC|nr:CBS domain-containing protein [Salinisphaera hydrothermalis]KEZ77288.1 CBS domain-containing membrane protein [Salinisphaera hydrothermalis C41B8]
MSAPTYARVADIMTREVITLGRHDTLCDARRLMGEHQIRNVPVLDENRRLVGLVNQKIILREALRLTDAHGYEQLDDRMAEIPVFEVLDADFKTLSGDTSLADAGRLLLEHRQASLPVVDHDALVGILSVVDYVRMAIDLLEDDQAG